MKTVVICVKDDGRVRVGELPAGATYENADYDDGADQAPAGAEHLQEVGSVREALSIAMDLLSGNTPEQEEQAAADLDAGYNEAGGRVLLPEAAAGY